MKRIKENSYVMDNKVDVLFCKEKNRAQQHLKSEVDINNIVAKFMKTGVLGDPSSINRRQAVFTDVSKIGSFHDTLNKIDRAKEAFMELPADVRKRFNHDPGELVAFLGDVKNTDEAIKLGLVVGEVKEKPVAPLATGDAAPKAPTAPSA